MKCARRKSCGNIGWSISPSRGHVHRLPGRASGIALQPILCAFRAPGLGIGALASREQRSFKTLASLYVEIFHCWMEYEQRVIIRFHFQEDANADDIHRRLQAQFTDDAYSIRSVRRWCQFIRQRREDLHDDPRSGGPPIDFIDTKLLSE
jgi:hypothetical protein